MQLRQGDQGEHRQGLTYHHTPVKWLGLKVLRESSEASGEQSARWSGLETRQQLQESKAVWEQQA